MKHICGYVCIGEKKCYNLNFIFGADENELEHSPFSKALNPFLYLTLAQKNQKELKEKFKEFEKIKLGLLHLKIAENENEFGLLEERNLIVIATNKILGELEYKLYGEIIKGSVQPGESLTINGLKLYQNFKEPLDMIFQINRHCEIPATMANFNLKYIN